MDPYCVYAALMLEKFSLARGFFFNCSSLEVSVLSFCILSICVVLFAVVH